MFKVLKNNDGFSGLIGLLIAIVVIGIMSAMILPTFTARMNYKQAQYVAGVTKTIENAENAYMAKNGSFADLVTLSQNGYLSPQFLQSLQPANNPGGPYPQPNWITLNIAKQTVNLCIANDGGCPDNPSGNNYFIGLYSVPGNYANYIEHELPGSGIGSQGGGLEYVAYAAPVPSAPPANASGATPAAKYTQTWTNYGFYTWTVPSGVTVIGVTLAGGSGGIGGDGGYDGGIGGELSDQLLNVSPGETLNVYVAENGYENGGGAGYGYGYGGSCSGDGGGGGGSSAVVASDTGEVIMAPGGGGGTGGFGYGGGGGGTGGGSCSGGGYGGGGTGGTGGSNDYGGNGGYPGGAGYNSNGAPSGIIPGPGYGFVEIQWN